MVAPKIMEDIALFFAARMSADPRISKIGKRF